MRKVASLRDILNAMRADKSPKAQEYYYESYEDATAPHCAIGGAARQLGVRPGEVGLKLSKVRVDEPIEGRNDLFSIVTYLNDRTPTSKEEIAERLLNALSQDALDRRFYFTQPFI